MAEIKNHEGTFPAFGREISENLHGFVYDKLLLEYPGLLYGAGEQRYDSGLLPMDDFSHLLCKRILTLLTILLMQLMMLFSALGH